MSHSPQIVVNGEPQPWQDGTTLASLIEQLGLSGKRIAVEVNQDIIPRAQHDQHALCAGDQVEIIQAIGGG